jgi:hypothetical protein
LSRTRNRRPAGRGAWLAAACCLLAAAACPAQEDDARPKIFLEKKVYSSATETGRRVFYETRTVGEGDTLWKILTGRGALTPDQYADQLREFRRINPAITDPDKLVPGQRLQVPLSSGAPDAGVRDGKAVAHRVAKGQSLTRILRARGVARPEMAKYLGAVKALNPAIRNVDKIMAGKTIYLPTEGYFKPTEALPPKEVAGTAGDVPEPKLVEAPPPPVAASEPAPAPEATPAPEPAAAPSPAATTAPGQAASNPPASTAEAPPAPVSPEPPSPAEPPVAALTREAAQAAEEPEIPVAKPEAQLEAWPKAAATEEPPVSSVTAPSEKIPPAATRPERPPYRGLLADVAAALGEKWIDRGTLYLPMEKGGEVVVNLADFPVVRFGTGRSALIDFHGSLPSDVRTLVSGTWKDYGIVALDSASGPEERIDRLLAASGYASVKEGTSRPLVIGESVSVTLPSRWQLFRTRQALEAGDVTLLKEVPEKMSAGLDAVLTYAGRLGIRVLPVAWDTATREGFMAGLTERKLEAPEPRRLPSGALPALDAALSLLSIPSEVDPTIRVSGKNDAFRLTVRPERGFTVDGVRYIADLGQMSPAIRSLVKSAGYRVFPLGKGESGKIILLRLLKLAGHPYEERRRYLLAGGSGAGFELHVSGTFITSKRLLESRSARALIVVKGRQHAATRAMLRELGIEVIEWVD